VAEDEATAGRGRARRKSTPAEVPFEKALGRLQEIVEALESGERSLEESLRLFEEGVSLSRRCQMRLDDAERRLEILVRRADGSEAIEPFAEGEAFPEAPGGGNAEG
jgi:exodeoxyribonuclease VII small subunit